MSKAVASVNTRAWLVAIVVAYLIFAVAYNVVTPAGTAIQHNPDENGHLQYIQRLVEGHLPVFRGAAKGPEYHQPPLYYLLCAPVYAATKGLGPSTSMHCVRAVSTVIGIFLILATYRCARRLFPEPLSPDPSPLQGKGSGQNNSWVALFTAGFVALLPMNVAMNASIGNDSLTNLLVALGLMLLVEIAIPSPQPPPLVGKGGKDPDTTRSSETSLQPSPWNGVGARPVLLGVVLGLIVLTKSSAIVLFPVALVAFVLLGYRKAMPPAIALRSAAIAIGLGLVIGSPWLIRNTVLYGDPLGQRLFLKSFGNTAQADRFFRLLGFGGYEGLVGRWTFASFWGVFDQMTAWWGYPTAPGQYLPLPAPLPPMYLVLAIVSAVPVLGLFFFFRGRKVSAVQSSLLWSMLLLILATGYGFTMFTMQFFQAQGRYWFTALVPLALFFALGYRGLFARETWYRAAASVMLLGLVLLNAYTIWGLLIPRFAGE